MEDEVRQILRSAARDDWRAVRKLGARIADRFKTAGLTDDLPELGGQAARPAVIDE